MGRKNCLVTRFVADDDENGAVSGFDAVFDQSSNSFVHLFPHDSELCENRSLCFEMTLISLSKPLL